MKHLRITDPEIARAILLETRRQGEKLELIASENFASEAVFEAQNSVLMNKYAEGYPGRRYYGGCEHVDIAERLAIERAKLLFDADHANVQPHSGTQANMQAYFSLLEPGDTILGLNLAHGGHLSHGHPVNFSGRYFKTAFYGVERETGTIDYDQVRAAALASRPQAHRGRGERLPPHPGFRALRRRGRGGRRAAAWPTSPTSPGSWPRACTPPPSRTRRS